MKKSRLAITLFILVLMSFFSCNTTRETYMQNGIELFPAVQLEKLSSSDYRVIETLRGTSEITVSKEEIAGDTGKYGILDDSFALSNILNFVTNIKWKLNNPEEVARLNANYDLIEKANKIEADAIWMPRTTKEVIVERNRTVIKVTVVAKAVQILNK